MLPFLVSPGQHQSVLLLGCLRAYGEATINCASYLMHNDKIGARLVAENKKAIVTGKGLWLLLLDG